MASWVGDGLLSGFSIVGNTTNVPESALNDLTGDRIHLVTTGTVNTQGVTRLQWPVNDASGNFRNALNGAARMAFTDPEIVIRPNPNNPAFLSGLATYMAMVMVDSAVFADGIIPTPAQIMAVNPANATVVTSSDRCVSGTRDYDFAFGLTLSVNRKYWVLMLPVLKDTLDSANPSLSQVYPHPTLTPNGFGRAVSVWGNRTPNAPTFTAPTADITVAAGDTFTLSWAANDPDGFPGGSSSNYSDTAGVQIQYAPQATPSNPSPEWIDLPIGTKRGTVGPGSGWWIDQSQANAPKAELDSGSFYFWAQGTMPVKCGSLTKDPGAGILPSGKWQIRMRTFDYGHPYPRWKPPLGDEVRFRDPTTYPTSNISDWSKPLRVSVSAQVPPPIPLSPRANIALVQGKPITLTWDYRNTVSPPNAQARRTVDIRKVNDPNWTTVTDTNSAAESYTLTDTPPVVVPPGTYRQYFADGGFENGTDGWVAYGGGNNTLTSTNAVAPHSGTRCAITGGTGRNINIGRDILLVDNTNFIWDFWSYEGPTSRGFYYEVRWYNPAGDQIIAYGAQGSVPRGGGWRQTTVNFTRPANAGKLQLFIGVNPGDAGTTTAGDRFDDMSLRGEIVGETGAAFTPVAPFQYEWRVRTTDSSGVGSDYSPTARFWMVPVPASGLEKPLPRSSISAATLGCGTHRVEVYRRGGLTRVGELDSVSYVDWSRLRDDISDAKIVISGWSRDCGNLLRKLQTWAYEIVIYRTTAFGTVRVWEGPITLLTYEVDKVTIQAKDVMAYAYRRIIKQDMNDAGLGDTVVSRAARVLQNVMAPEDPNLLSYVSVISDPADSKEYRNLPAYTRTAFEEIDDMAANSGLDYCAVGRRVLLWGTKHRIGTLPEFRDEDLGATPIVSEYGMQAANSYSVADGTGVHGDANRLNPAGEDPIYGLIEMLSSSWSSDSPAEAGTYTQEGLATVVKSFEGYAESSISSRWPPPVVVRVPDNTTLNPSAVIDIQQLVPGVVIPLRSTSTLRPVSANQKLDSVKVTEQGGKETITVVMSPFSREDTDLGEPES